MGAMNEFLRWVVEPSTAQLYTEMNERCAQWVQATNRRLPAAQATAGADPLNVRLGAQIVIWSSQL